MDGHFKLMSPTADSGDPYSNDTHFVVAHKGNGLNMPPNAVNDTSIADVVNRIAKTTNALIRLPADSDTGIEKAKMLQEEYRAAFEQFAGSAGKELALRVKRVAKVNPTDAEISVNWE